MGCTNWSASRWSTMSNTKLQDFVTQTAARSQITFGDVRRLRRDCLPGGIDAGEEVGILIWLDSKVSRADKAWSQWLVAAVADFALRSEVTEDGIVDWLKRLTATTAQGTTVRPRILREIGRGKQSSGATTSLPIDESSAAAQAAAAVVPAADAGAHETSVDRPRLRRCPRPCSGRQAGPGSTHASPSPLLGPSSAVSLMVD